MKLDDFRTLIVAIDTSTDMLACSVAWWTPEVFFDDTPSRACVEVLASRDHLCRRHANIELVDTVKTALSDAGKTIEDVGGFLVGRGPGSFTGVRIGISTARSRLWRECAVDGRVDARRLRLDGVALRRSRHDRRCGRCHAWRDLPGFV